MKTKVSLNSKQLDAISHHSGPLLVLAGAGSGKTQVVTHRIGTLIQNGVEPDRILAVTFTNKAAQEMQERVHALLRESTSFGYPTICTFHSLGVRILRESIHHLGYPNQFTIYDEEDSNKLLRGCLESLELKSDGKIKALRALISAAKNDLKNPYELNLSEIPEAYQPVFKEVYALYQERLRTSQALDFDDLLFMTVRLFQEHQEVLHKYQERWPFLLIDEYQDTNQAQYLMARLIVGRKQNIFVVGDPDQSIYSWRGANIKNILNFENDYPGARIIRLEQNYRSRSNILDAANALIKNNESRYEKTLWSDKGNGEQICLFIGGSEREEAGFVIHEIERLHSLHHIPLSEMTIFYRTNFQSRVFEDFLLRKRIPYVIVGGISFYHRKEIKDILCFLRLICSDADTIAFERTLNLPKRGIGPTTLENLKKAALDSGLSVFTLCTHIVDGKVSGIRLSAKQKEGLQNFVALIQSLRELQKTTSLEELVKATILQSRYLDHLREDKETFADRKANVEELIAKAHEWETLNDSHSLESFLEELSLKSSLDEATFSHDQVNLMTLHNGKGLEFDTAFLVGMEEDLFPHVNSRDSEEGLEEERRLCYVGMTRAKERLYLSAAQTRFLWGTHRMMRPSRFLLEIPKEYLKRHR